jgi:hypothetical protein
MTEGLVREAGQYRSSSVAVVSYRNGVQEVLHRGAYPSSVLYLVVELLD